MPSVRPTVRPTIRQLEYLLALAETRNFRKAAEACFVSQPALSGQIAELERTLGVRLFERDRRRVLPTAAGAEVIAGAREVLAAADRVREAARSHRPPLTGTLRLGVIPTVAPYLLPSILPAAREKYPQLRLLLLEEQTSRLLDRLENGRLDAAVLALPVPSSDLAKASLFSDEFLLAAPSGHRLARKGKVETGDLEGEEVLLLEDGHCLRDQALEVCRGAGAREQADFRATSLPTLVQMVASGAGVTLLPRIAVECEPRETRMYAVRQFASPAPGRRIGLVWRKNAPRQEDYRLLARLIRAHVPKGGRRIDPEQTEKPETPKKAERLETPEKPKKPDKPKKRQMGRSPR